MLGIYLNNAEFRYIFRYFYLKFTIFNTRNSRNSPYSAENFRGNIAEFG
jgi:hypothetical protein